MGLKKKIIVVDDEESVLRPIVREVILRHAHEYEIIICVDGDEALLSLKKGADAILLDLNMPYLDGMSVCRAMKQDETLKTIPIIIVSGNITDENRKELTALGVQYFFEKPYLLSSLFETLQRIT